MNIYKRTSYLQKIEHTFQFLPIVVLIGARQVGKTTIMNSFAEECKKKSLFLNGQDPEVAALFGKLSSIEQYLHIWLNEDLDGLLLIDEFQFIENVSTMLKL